MGAEGIDIKFRIHPITAIVCAIILVTGAGSVRFLIRTAQYNANKVPFLSSIIPSPLPTPDPWRDSAYSGILRKTTDGKFYLQTASAQAITLSIPANVNLEKYVGKRIFASGRYNIQTQILVVTEGTPLEVLPPVIVTVPTSSPTPTP